jgi:hypothetical protein
MPVQEQPHLGSGLSLVFSQHARLAPIHQPSNAIFFASPDPVYACLPAWPGSGKPREGIGGHDWNSGIAVYTDNGCRVR